MVEPVARRFECAVRQLDCVGSDSFLILNGNTVLDVTPTSSDNGAPEVTDDPVVVDLYMRLFERMSTTPASIARADGPQLGETPEQMLAAGE